MRAIAVLFLLAASASAQIVGVGNRKVFHSGGGAVTLVQKALSSTSCANGSGVTTCAAPAFAAATIAGDTIAVALCWAGNAGTGGTTNNLTGVTGQGTFTVLTGSLVNYGATTHQSNVGCEWAIATGITGGVTTAETCAFANADNQAWCVAYELTASTSTQTSSGKAATVPNIIASSVTPAANGAFLIDATIQDDGSGCACGYTAGSTWTFDQTTGSGNIDAGVQHLAQTTASASTSPLATNRNPAQWVDSQIVVQP